MVTPVCSGGAYELAGVKTNGTPWLQSSLQGGSAGALAMFWFNLPAKIIFNPRGQVLHGGGVSKPLA